MMLFLSISLLPQKTVHEWLVCHKDRITHSIANDDQAQVSKQNLHCSCDQPEFQSPFTISSVYSTAAYKVFIHMDTESLQVSHYCIPVQSADERGPPVQLFV